jgi:geranylgeranyl reductase family protein
MLHFDSDVLVVGAGPAGTVAARRLASAGVRVHVVDRASFPRDKLCGDTLNPGCLAMLSRIDPGVGDRVRARGLRIRGMTVTGPRGSTVAADYPEGFSGASLTRRDLDQWLLESAVDAGARFDDGLTVHAPLSDDAARRVAGVRAMRGKSEFDIRARVVIAADGRASRLATALQLSRFAPAPRRWAYGAYYTGVEGLTAHGEMHIRADGYVGVAPMPDGLANVCVVRSRANLVAGQPPDAVMTCGINADPALAARLTRAQRVSDVVVLGPLAVDSNVAGCAGLLLAGDAAGFVDPMTGDGLRFAIRGGELAAQAALLELESGVPAFDTLRAWRAREFTGKWRINRALRALVDSPMALALAARAARVWPQPVGHLVEVAGDIALARRSGRLQAEATEKRLPA